MPPYDVQHVLAGIREANDHLVIDTFRGSATADKAALAAVLDKLASTVPPPRVMPDDLPPAFADPIPVKILTMRTNGQLFFQSEPVRQAWLRYRRAQRK